jgi:ABC-type sugar transport system substrate-binding protein
MVGGLICWAPSVAKAADKLTIGVSMDTLQAAFWVANEKAMKKEADKLGVNYVLVIAEGDANKQNQQVENLIAQGVNAIVISAKDGAAIVAALKKARDAGIPTVMDNRPVQGDFVPDLTVFSDNTAMAKQSLQWFVDKAKTQKKTYNACLLIGNLGDENAILRKNGHMEVIDANPDVIKLVAQVPTEWQHEVALAGLQNAFQAHPEINLIITPSDDMFPPIKSALEQIGRWKKIGQPGHVAVVSFDGDENGMQNLKDGYNWVDAAQASEQTGILCIDWAVKMANGQKPPNPVFKDPGVIVTIDNVKKVGPTIWGWAGVK